MHPIYINIITFYVDHIICILYSYRFEIMSWSPVTKPGSNPSHLEVLLDLHELLQDSSVGGVLLTDPLLQAIHPST